MSSTAPKWEIPDDLEEIVAEEERWESEDWFPILLTVMGGTVYNGREIPLAWQIEFDPDGEEFENANQRVAESGLEPDGYGWASVIQRTANKYHPEITNELQFGDTEEAACVIWVESENTCKVLIKIVWDLINAN